MNLLMVEDGWPECCILFIICMMHIKIPREDEKRKGDLKKQNVFCGFSWK